ncbi:polysaccharide biosynthesis/export family protein [uncultured Brevundimonas sp.]|uniref:polysaccharide biosynthesis/export family protein n=1 Tax=uncultured Brevundimonas sp. TaxID=213418 RepID=UPI0030EDC70A|tara:strand:+ start:1277 stop:1981 length:705 start_codon:yes stop_codon:yes gene_type:complete
MMRKVSIALLATVLAGCAGTSRETAGVSTMTALAIMNDGPVEVVNNDIGVLDRLDVIVFQVPDLTFVGENGVRVDASGLIEMPLIGSLQAAGRTPSELGTDIRTRLASRYLQNPQVTVRVAEAGNQKITVDGAVTEPGVYETKGQTTLLQAVAMAKGATRVADLTSVAVFRTVENRRMVAVFDLDAIRGGYALDPVLQGDDVVVVDTSRLSSIMRDVLAAAPAFASFFYYATTP